MQRIHWGKCLFLSAIFCHPINLWATRGADDYGIMMTVMFMIYSFPVGLLLVCFIIYLIVKLRSAEKPRADQGKTILIISIILIIPTVIIPIFLMYKAGWHPLMIEVMLADFIPILLLSITSAVLSMRVKKRSLYRNNDEKGEKIN